MNVIDDKAFPIVAKMIRGESVILDPRTQSDLALWICKIVVTARSINHRDLPGDIKWAEWLYQRREPLPDWQIWIAHYVGSAPFYYQTHGIDVREPPGPNQSPSEMPIIDADGAMATLTMGYFVAQIFGFSSSMKWAATETQGFPRIWPMSKFLIPWPSFPSLDDNGLRFAAQRLLATKVPGLPVHSDEVKPIS